MAFHNSWSYLTNRLILSIEGKNLTDSKDVTLTSADITSIFIEPSFNVTENSAIFL